MPDVKWAEALLRDLSSIDAFLARGDPELAARMLRAIRTAALRLEDYPRIGRAIDEPFRVLGVRATPYLLVYRIIGAEVEVARVRHGREDWLPQPEGEI